MKNLLIILLSITWLSGYSQIFTIKDNQYLPILNLAVDIENYEFTNLDGTGWVFYKAGDTADTIIVNAHYVDKKKGVIAPLKTVYVVNRIDIKTSIEGSLFYVFKVTILNSTRKRTILLIKKEDVYDFVISIDSENFFIITVDMQ